MSSIDDLRRALDAHAPDLTTDPGLVERPSAVRRRVTAVRRRRAATGAALAVAVIGGGAWLATGVPGGETAPGPAEKPTSSVTESASGRVTFRSEANGFPLVASTAADPGFSATSLGLVLPTHPEFAIHCVRPVAAPGSGPDMPWVSVEVNGWTALLVSCGDGGPSDDDPAEFLYGPGGDGTRPGLVVSRTAVDGTQRDRWLEPDTNVELTVRLADEDGGTYDGPVDGVEIGIGVYAGR